MKSFASLVFSNISSASSSKSSNAVYRVLKCVKINSSELLCLAILAASEDVEWKLSFALSASSFLYVDSWIKMVESFANSIISSQGVVSPEYVILFPFLAGPNTCSGLIILPLTFTSSPLCNCLKAGPTGTPSSIAFSRRNLGFLSSSIEYAKHGTW